MQGGGRDRVCDLDVPVLTEAAAGGFEVSADGAAYCRSHAAAESQ